MANQIKEREKELILAMMMALKETQVDEKFIKENIEQIFQLEVQENMKYKYNPIYFTQHMPDGSISTLDEARKYFARLGSDIHLSFIHNQQEKATSGKTIVGMRGEVTPKVIINLASYKIEKINSSNPEERMTGYKDLIHTLFHENHHMMQKWMNQKGIISNENIRNARDNILIRTLDEEWYSNSGRTGNYESYSTENSADLVAFEKYLDIMGEDFEMSAKADILRGKINLGRYKANINSRNHSTHYQSNGREEKDDITIPILDDLICRKGLIELLEEYPVLKEEYNLDGTKKSSVELIKRMKEKIEEISKDTELSPTEKKKMIDTRQEFYYELIYNTLERNTPEENKKIVEELGEEKSTELFINLTKYFKKEKANKKEILQKMLITQDVMEDWIEPSNNGVTRVVIDQSGKVARANKRGFIKYMKNYYPEQMEKNYRVPTYDGKSTLESAEEIVEQCFEYLPRYGKLTNGKKEYTVDDVMSKYLISLERGIPVSFIEFMKGTEISVPYKEQYLMDAERIENYYEDKMKFISEVRNQIFEGKEIPNRRKSKVTITPKDIKDTVYTLPVGWGEIIEIASKIAPKEKGKDLQNQER